MVATRRRFLALSRKLRPAVLPAALLLGFAPAAFAQTTYSGTVNFGTVSVGASSAQTITFNFSSPTALNVTTPVQVLTAGAANLDFKNAGTGTCGPSTYSSCTVNVSFAPTAPGLRLGAIVVEDLSGNVLSTAYIYGIGQGPAITYTPFSTVNIGSGASDPQGVAVDGAGNVYIADAGTSSVYRVTPGGTQTTLTTNANGADGIAVDGAGNVYVATTHASTITRISPAGVQTAVGSGLSFPAGMCFDGPGNLYIANVGANNIIEITPGGTQSVLTGGLNSPAGVAFDANGNLFIADAGGGRIAKFAGGTLSTVLGSGLSYPESVAVDAAENLYVPLAGGAVDQITPTLTVNQLATLGFPVGIAVDATGNVFVAQGSQVVELNRATPPTVAFLASDPVGTLSPDSPQTLTLNNVGNNAITFSVPASGTNPNVTPSSYSLEFGSTCPRLTTSSTAATLNPALSCNYLVDFTPAASGAITGSLVVTDNSLNVVNVTQTIPLTNNAPPPIITATVTVNTVFTNYTGSPIPVTVTTNPAGLAVSILYGPFGGTPTDPNPPSAVGFYSVTATVTTPGYTGSGSGYLIINAPPQTTPTITWPTPAPINVGTPLSGTQLNATASTAGTFSYSIASGITLAAGSYAVTASFTPTDTIDFTNASATDTIVVQGNVQPITPINFGSVPVASASTTRTVTFTFINPVTLNATTPVQVLTQGTAGLDFHNTAAGSCTSTAYAAAATCTVTVNVTPSAPGSRAGAVVLYDTTGTPAASALLGVTGTGPQIAYDPGTQSNFAVGVVSDGVAADAGGNVYINTGSTVVKVAPGGAQTTVASGFSSEGGTAVDGAGNIYVADSFGNRVLEFTTSGLTLNVGNGFSIPYSVAVDGLGNVYVADTRNGQAVEVSAGGVQTTLATGFTYPEGIAVDAAGNVFVSDNTGGNGTLTKIAPGGAQTILATGLLSPFGVAVDAAGNVFAAGATNQTVAKVSTTGVKTTFASGLSFPFEIALDSTGNLYIAHATATVAGVIKVDRTTPPSFNFAATNVGSVSSDSPQAVTLDNIGNATLSFPKPSTGTNASISTNFQFFAATTCPRSTNASTLNAGATCVYSADFLPTTSGSIAGDITLTDNALNAATATQNIALSGTGNTTNASATVTLGSLTQTYTGSPLSATATTSPAGLAVSFTYNGSASPPTTAGTYTVVATVTTSGYTGSATGAFIINQATPTVTWSTPAPVTYGTQLSAAQLNATSATAGSFAYTPASGSMPSAGTDSLSVLFTPTDATDYTTATKTVQLVVNQATPTITWPTPAAITYGAQLGSTQLNATSATAGTFSYTPASGSTPPAGTITLSTTFTPTDTTDYTTATKTVQIVVNQATPAITWSTPGSIVYGTPLSSSQLNATSTTAGTFTYTPASGATPSAGTDTLSVLFTPTDATDYTTATKTAQIVVNQTTPTITWPTPGSITYGTPLSATQLNATSTTAGTFAYTPASGSTPSAGTITLSTTFTPTDATDYTTATKTVQLLVNQATPAITWSTPAAITYGTALSGVQLNATSTTAGTFAYAPASGAILQAGTTTLSASFTPADTTDYATTTKSATLIINPAALTVTANNATRIYGLANPTFTGTLNGAVNNDSLTEAFSTTATSTSNAGSYAIAPSATGTDIGSYTQSITNGTLTVTQAAATTTLTLSSNSIVAGQSVTLTAKVASSTTGTPTGTVQFLDGITLLGTGTLTSGTATFATASLAIGTHAVTAVYQGDTNFTASNSGVAQTLAVTGALDFTILPITTSSDVIPGAAATFSVQLSPASGGYPSTVSFAASGLPSGATATFSPSTIAANAGPQTVVITIQTPAATAALHAPSRSRNFAPFALALLLLPFAVRRRSANRLRSSITLTVFLLASAAISLGLSGCGAGNGFFGQAQKTYTVTITATSGSVQHTANVNLTIQ